MITLVNNSPTDKGHKAMQVLKNKLLTVLDNCCYNKTIYDFNLIQDFKKLISSPQTKDISIKYKDDYIFINLWYLCNHYSLMFTDSNNIILSLPYDITIDYIIINCDYNKQYNDIKQLLINK